MGRGGTMNSNRPTPEEILRQAGAYTKSFKPKQQPRDGTRPNGADEAGPQKTEKRSANMLQAKQFEPVKWIVPNYVPEGLTVFAGKPKSANPG